MISKERALVPEGYGLVAEGKIRTGDLVWKLEANAWEEVRKDRSRDFESVDDYLGVARPIFAPIRDVA